MYLNVLGKPMLVLGSMEAATDLLEKRSANYSSKPPSAMADLSVPVLSSYAHPRCILHAHALMCSHRIGIGWNVALLGNQDEHWRRQRRELHRFLGTPVGVAQFTPALARHTHTFLHNLLDSPQKFSEHAHLQVFPKFCLEMNSRRVYHRAMGSMIMEISYGLDVKSPEDEYLRLAREGNEIFMKAFVPGKYLVETLHVLKRVPAWVPGARFQREAAEWREAYAQVRQRPFEAAMELLVGSFVCCISAVPNVHG